MRNGEGIDNGKKKQNKKKRNSNSNSNNRPNKQKNNILHFADKCAQNYKKLTTFSDVI